MPKIENVTLNQTMKVDLTEFFGEEAFITIRRINKNLFTYLAIKSRDGYSSKLFEKTLDIIKNRPDYDENQAVKDVQMTIAEYDEARNSFSMEEVKKGLEIDAETEVAYFKESIMSDGHNFTDMSGNLVELSGTAFYDMYNGLKNSFNVPLSDYVLRVIMTFNRTGLDLGESTSRK